MIASLAGVDRAGGALIAGGQNFVRYNGILFIVRGDRVQSHGDVPHRNPRVATSSATVRINGIGVARAGDRATCGHVCTGSSNLDIGS